MRLHNLLMSTMIAFTLTACADEPSEGTEADGEIVEEVSQIDDAKDLDEAENDEESEVIEVAIEEESMEIDEHQPLENVGEYKYTRDGRVELLHIARPTETYTLIDGVELDFNDIKIMHYSEIPESEKEYIRDVFGFDDEGYTLQLAYTATNHTDETIGGIEVEDLVTSNGNQYSLYIDGINTVGSSYEVRPNAKTDVGVVFSVVDPDIDSITLYFQPYDKDGYHLDEVSLDLDI